jgi:hypothetical protein
VARLGEGAPLVLAAVLLVVAGVALVLVGTPRAVRRPLLLLTVGGVLLGTSMAALAIVIGAPA